MFLPAIDQGDRCRHYWRPNFLGALSGIRSAAWPVDVVAELIDRITVARHGGFPAERELAWADTAARRSAELDNGKATLVPGDQVSQRIRKIVGR